MATTPDDEELKLVVPKPDDPLALVIEDDKKKLDDTTTIAAPMAAPVTSIGTGDAPKEEHEQKAEGGQKRVQPLVGTEHWVKPVHTGDPFKDWLLDILGFIINLVAHCVRRLGPIVGRLVALPFALVAAPFSAKARQFIVDTPRAVLNNVGSFFKNFDDAVLGMPAKVLLNKDELVEQRKRDKAEAEAKIAQEENPAMKKKLEGVNAGSAALRRTGPPNPAGHPEQTLPFDDDAEELMRRPATTPDSPRRVPTPADATAPPYDHAPPDDAGDTDDAENTGPGH